MRIVVYKRGRRISNFRLQQKFASPRLRGNTNQDIWILAFTGATRTLLAGSNLSLKDKIDDIEVYLMSLEDVSLVYNAQTTNITEVISFNHPKGKSD